MKFIFLPYRPNFSSQIRNVVSEKAIWMGEIHNFKGTEIIPTATIIIIF